MFTAARFRVPWGEVVVRGLPDDAIHDSPEAMARRLGWIAVPTKKEAA